MILEFPAITESLHLDSPGMGGRLACLVLLVEVAIKESSCPAHHRDLAHTGLPFLTRIKGMGFGRIPGLING